MKHGERLTRKTAYLTIEMIEYLEQVGDDNFSEGVRRVTTEHCRRSTFEQAATKHNNF